MLLISWMTWNKANGIKGFTDSWNMIYALFGCLKRHKESIFLSIPPEKHYKWITANSYLIWTDKLCFLFFCRTLGNTRKLISSSRRTERRKKGWIHERVWRLWWGLIWKTNTGNVEMHQAGLILSFFSRVRTQTWRKSSKILMHDRIYLPVFSLSCFLIKNFSVLVCKVEFRASTSLTTLWSAFKIPNSWLKTSFLFALGCTLCPWEASYRVCKQTRP